MSSRYYDRQGNPITAQQWIPLLDGGDYQRVALTERDDIRVSTVYLGLNHAWDDGPPLIFETMIFGGPHDEQQWRYSTEAEAIEGHQFACGLAFGHKKEKR